MPFRYLLFHKPFQVMSQFTDGGRKTLADYIDVPGVYAAGRLDYDSEGLLLLTNDGVFQHRLTDPRYDHPRTYHVQVEGQVTEQAIEQLQTGITIGNYRTKPSRAFAMAEPPWPPRQPPIRFRRHIPTSWLSLRLTEGRNRQVRRMTAAVGFPTLRLIRVAIGLLTIDELLVGTWRDLKTDEVARFKKR